MRVISDKQWLLERLPLATKNQVDMFLTRVATICGEPQPDNHRLRLARGLALEAIQHEYGPVKA